MTQKNTTEKIQEIEKLSSHSEEDLNKVWGKNQVVLGRYQVERMLKAFDSMSIKEGSSKVLIFEDTGFGWFREAGNLHNKNLVCSLKEIEEAKRGDN